MAFAYLTNTPIDKAKADYLKAISDAGFAAPAEAVKTAESCGRVTAEAVYAKICAPHYHACAMDGIALRASLTFGAGETTPVKLGKNGFVEVDTGDPLPEGCDAVVMIEDVVKNGDGTVSLYAAAAPWQHIRQIGEDVCAGEMILPSHSRITPSAIGAMLAGGVGEVKVLKRPVIGIIPTGDEVVPPSDSPKPGDVMEFNSSIFSSMTGEWGAESIVYPICPDRPEMLENALSRAIGECDIVLLNAGSSAGRDDYASMTIGALGDVLYHGLAIKPGKPAVLGLSGKKPVIGVPGYPVSGIIVIEEIVKDIVRQWYGTGVDTYEYVDAVLARPLVSGLKYKEYVRTRIGRVGDKYVASPLNRGAGVVSSFMKADGIITVPQGTEGFEAGESVNVRLLRSKTEIDNTIVVIGSHDPLLDELSDMLHAKNPELYMSSTHVGSMGGIMAARRCENHAAGIHLLNEEDGTYNIAALKKFFPNGGVKLVECVGRTQGLMLQKGNPKGIRSFADIAGKDVSYVNRQKGSGTRILADYLCRKYSLSVKNIYGYDREELTHTSVAAQIANMSGDAGMGIYSAAKLYGLDFLPICTETYDLLIPDYAFETENVQKLIEALGSDEFRARIERLGGYTLDRPGRVKLEL